jgi:hypothetical protein
MDPSVLIGMRGFFDPENIDSHLIVESFFHKQIGMLKSRFENSIHMGAINIYDIDCFTEFVRTGLIMELLRAFGGNSILRFGKELLRTQLAFMYKTVHENYAQDDLQQFYFADFKGDADTCRINFDNGGTMAMNEKNEDIINSNFYYSDKDAAKLLYAVASNAPSAGFVLSKEETLIFLQKLFVEVLGGTAEELDSCLENEEIIVAP